MDTSNGSSSKRNNQYFLAMISKTIKQLQNLYSWNQFYQDRKMKPQMKKCQSDIHTLKTVINELKTKKK